MRHSSLISADHWASRGSLKSNQVVTTLPEGTVNRRCHGKWHVQVSEHAGYEQPLVATSLVGVGRCPPHSCCRNGASAAWRLRPTYPRPPASPAFNASLPSSYFPCSFPVRVSTPRHSIKDDQGYPCSYSGCARPPPQETDYRRDETKGQRSAYEFSQGLVDITPYHQHERPFRIAGESQETGHAVSYQFHQESK